MKTNFDFISRIMFFRWLCIFYFISSVNMIDKIKRELSNIKTGNIEIINKNKNDLKKTAITSTMQLNWDWAARNKNKIGRKNYNFDFFSDITTCTGASAFLIFLLLLVQEKDTLKWVYIDIYCLLFIILLWPFTSPKCFDTNNIFLGLQVVKRESFVDTLIVSSGVVCYICLLSERVILIVQDIHQRKHKRLLVLCIILLICEYLTHDCLEHFVEGIVQTGNGNAILQIVIHILMYVVTFEIFHISHFEFGIIVCIYLCITYYFISPIPYFFCSIILAIPIGFKLIMDNNCLNFTMNFDSIRFQRIKTFVDKLWRDNQRFKEIAFILFISVLLRIKDILL